MSDMNERRREKRLRYNWPVWFADDFNDVLSQGQMVDICSGGAGFTCYADKCPSIDDHVTTRFSVPLYDHDGSFDLENFVRPARICRIDEMSPFVRRVAIQFDEVLPFKPGEVADTSAVEIDEMDKTLELAKSN